MRAPKTIEYASHCNTSTRLSKSALQVVYPSEFTSNSVLNSHLRSANSTTYKPYRRVILSLMFFSAPRCCIVYLCFRMSYPLNHSTVAVRWTENSKFIYLYNAAINKLLLGF